MFSKREPKMNCYDYAIDVYKIQNDEEMKPSPAMEIEKPKPPPVQHFNEMVDLGNDEYMDEEAMLQLTLEMSKNEYEFIHKVDEEPQ